LTVEFKPQSYYDHVPTGPTSTRLFLLSNVGGRLLPPRDGLQEVDQSDLQRRNQDWTFTVLDREARWDADKNLWEPVREERFAALKVAFKEPFRAFIKDEFYYFVTDSGQVFSSGNG